MTKDDDITASIDEIEQKDTKPLQNSQEGQGSPVLDTYLTNNHGSNRFVRFIMSGPGRVLIVAVVLIAAALAIPMTRYAALGVVIKKDVTIYVVDETTGKPVSNAKVHYAREDAVTDNKGVATVATMPVGDHPLSIEKSYYQTTATSYTVPIMSSAKTTVKIKATGRTALVTVKNAISGKLVEGASVKIGDATAVTDDKGVANVVVPVKDGDQPGVVTKAGYRQADTTLTTKDMQPLAEVQLVPDGKTYFLSNRTGGYDVMSATLDGKDQQTVVKGTGKEVAYELQLSQSPSRAFLAYVARRDSDTAPNLYIVDTSTGGLTKVSDAQSPSVIGWVNNTLYFSLYNYTSVADKRIQLIAYSADTKQRTVVDSSHLEGDQYVYAEQGLSTRFQLIGSKLYYAKCWSYSNSFTGSQDRTASFMVVSGSSVTSLKDVPQKGQAYCDAVATKPNAIYFRIAYAASNTADSYRYIPGKSVESVQINDGQLYNSSYTFLTSPAGSKTYWTETRDGKRVSFIGDANGQNEVQVSGASYTAYGWLGDDYVLYSKDGSELYVAAAGDQLDGAHKITDYFSFMGVVN